MAAVFKKVKQGTRNKIVHAVFDVMHEILNALEENFTQEEEQKEPGKNGSNESDL
jgi:ABC-type sulfate transport system substrate-binding protein